MNIGYVRCLNEHMRKVIRCSFLLKYLPSKELEEKFALCSRYVRVMFAFNPRYNGVMFAFNPRLTRGMIAACSCANIFCRIII